MTNTRPQLDNSKSPSLTNIASNTGVPQNGSTTNATLVSDLISATSPLANFSDVDGDSAGLVITGINTNGTLYYSTNGGATWQTVMSLTSASALALLADANTYVYFRPNAGYSGTLSDAITFRAWDGTDGSTNGQVGLNINPAQIGALDTTGNVYDVAVVGNYAYVTDNGVGLKIIDVSDPSDLKLVGSINAAGVLGISVVGNYAYVAASDVGLQVFNIGNPSAPSLVGTRDTSGYAYDVAVVGNYAYVADWNAGLQIINISVPSNPSIVGTYNTSGMASAVAVVGNYAYVADYSAGLQIINVSTPSAPNLVSTLDTPGTANDVAVVGDYAYVADDTYGLQIINISNPSNPSLVGTYNTSNDARGVTVVGDIAYVAIGVFGLQMINISDPSNPTLVGSYDTSGYAADVAVVDNIAYVADYAAGLKVLTVQDAFSSSSDTASVVVTDNTAPTVTSVSVPSNATYAATQNLDFRINTSENVIVDTAGGTPRLAIDVGGTTKYATFQSGSGTQALVFRYTVESGLTDADGIAVSSLELNGGTLKDAAGNEMTLTLNSLGSTADVKVDSVAPTESDSTSSALEQTTATVSATSDEAGTMYYVVTTSETPPSAEEVVNHTAASLVTNAYGSSEVTAATQKDFSVTGLTASTQYYAYFVTVDAAGNQSAVASASFTTAIDPPPTIISTAVTTINEGAVYTYTLGASDNGDVSWSVKDGTSLPSWLTLGKGEALVTIVDDFTDPGGMAYNEATGDIYATYSSLFSAFVEDAIPQTKIYKLAEDGTQTLFTNTEFGQVGSMVIYGDYLYAGFVGYYGTTNILVRYDLRDADGDVTPEVLLQNADENGNAYYDSDVIAGLVEKDGYLYAVDYTNSDILKFDLANISAGPWVYLDFNPDLSTENSGPYGIAFDAQGNLYGTLMDSATVFKYDGEDLSVVMRIDGDVDGDGAQVLHGQPTDIKIDAEGNFYISHFGGTGGTSGIYKYNSSFVEQAPISTTANTWSMIFNNDGKIIAGDVQVDTQDPDNPTISGEIFGIDTVNYSLTGTAPLVNADTPTQITLVATDEAGNETEHSFTLTVHDLGAPTGTVTITGTAMQGQTLTASNTLADADGLGTMSYQWLADGQAITGATESTYTLSQAEVGKTMTVKASYTDGQGTAESVTSSATSAVANVNDAPTGTVTISGTATQGQMLTASNTLADADGLGTMSYQWLADGQAITGATESTYTLSQAEVGKAMTVKASYTDGQGTAESVTSSATSAVANVNDAPTGKVTISGTATQGQTLTASNTLADADGLGTMSYQWLADGQAITGATESTYTLSQAEVGKTMTVKASYTDGQGTAESVTSSATSAVANVNDAPTGKVTISGTATQGQTLTASNTLADADGLGTMSYQWLADGQAITGATESTYTLSQAEVGKTMTVKASYTDGQGTAESVTSSATSAVANVNDAPTGKVTISGTATQGQTLTASNTLADADGLGTMSYQWLADGQAITGATESTYTLSQAEVGKTMTVKASYTDGQGTAESVTSSATSAVANVNDAPTGKVTISGTATQGQTLTASNTLADADGLGTMSYQWLADGQAITGATESTYTLSQAEVGKTMTVKASYTDGQGTAESVTSSATSAVANVNDAPTGKVTISGTATQGQTLTASNTLADADGLGTMSYQWLADGQAITGATESTYTLSQAEVGKTMTVKASYTDGQGTAESVTSSATSAVAATPAPTQPPVTEAPTPAPTEPPVTEAPTPAPVTSTVDGTMVQTGTTTQTRTTTDATGQTVTTTVQVEQVIVTPVTDTRIEDTTTPSSQTADIPLFWGESTRTEWATTVSLPIGVGITTEGRRAPDINQDLVTTLTQLIEETAPETDGGKTNLLEGGDDFLATLAQQNTETLVINKITLTTANDVTQPASVPIVISGTANNVTTPSGNSAPPVEALVIDTRQLPAGSILDLQNIEFAVIVGDNVTIRGGEGANILFAGTGGQNIRLGADDDELHAGDGDDWVGSQGGNDQIFGEEGNDVLYGGTGNDTLDGGTGSDIALFQYAISQYAINQNTDGSWTISHATEGTDTVKEIEFAEFADQTISLTGNHQWLNVLFQQNISLF